MELSLAYPMAIAVRTLLHRRPRLQNTRSRCGQEHLLNDSTTSRVTLTTSCAAASLIWPCSSRVNWSPVSLRLGKVGYHELVVEQQDPAALVHWAKVLISTPILYSLSVTLPKVVILVLYHRIFATPAFRIANYIIMGMVIGLFIAAFITAVLTCIPLKAWWDHSVKGVCIDVTNYYRYGSLPNSILDLIMLVLPLPVIWKLQTSRRNRIGLTLTFLTGSA